MTEHPTEELPPIDFLYRDSDIAVVNKPSGMLVHRGWDNDKVVAMTVVRDHLEQYVYPVQRLDRPTSGALIFALHKKAARALCQAFESGQVHKGYLALVRGIAPESGTIDHPIPKEPNKERVPALTEFRRLFEYERYSLVAVWPKSGRLHQIRRHLKHLSHPLIGDTKYGKGAHNRFFRERFGLMRLGLHASSISFPHPQTGKELIVQAPMPQDFVEPLRAMGVPETLLNVGAKENS